MSHSNSNDFQSAILSSLTRGFFFIRLLYVKVIFAAVSALLSSSLFPEKNREKKIEVQDMMACHGCC
jgi:hypothetical protein